MITDTIKAAAHWGEARRPGSLDVACAVATAVRRVAETVGEVRWLP